ncbi:hypothetical protein SPRG_20701 [Saprolegnia parasitica CBS 223.65]|uniref:Uncharacterized protein n=1 Tax=Saprolegnia parasitica (strain CBS 223.65) TaxID=695850 RepID=A0A067CGC4_SAPPC|nr:hypothetical protein SPRG_20701 [Saprolegnia parasitica CBS 223.65]KDO25872.1 hypothetical protein SPRG_20701 [Saprolegnia parasitica CBS 223.65]|eukprot:XP_012203492.1 hypothetical protein SPRG_20701 [Saprolegnia parasitica CBS 223.65]
MEQKGRFTIIDLVPTSPASELPSAMMTFGDKGQPCGPAEPKDVARAEPKVHFRVQAKGEQIEGSTPRDAALIQDSTSPAPVATTSTPVGFKEPSIRASGAPARDTASEAAMEKIMHELVMESSKHRSLLVEMLTTNSELLHELKQLQSHENGANSIASDLAAEVARLTDAVAMLTRENQRLEQKSSALETRLQNQVTVSDDLRCELKTLTAYTESLVQQLNTDVSCTKTTTPCAILATTGPPLPSACNSQSDDPAPSPEVEVVHSGHVQDSGPSRRNSSATAASEALEQMMLSQTMHLMSKTSSSMVRSSTSPEPLHHLARRASSGFYEGLLPLRGTPTQFGPNAVGANLPRVATAMGLSLSSSPLSHAFTSNQSSHPSHTIPPSASRPFALGAVPRASNGIHPAQVPVAWRQYSAQPRGPIDTSSMIEGLASNMAHTSPTTYTSSHKGNASYCVNDTPASSLV